MYGECVNMRFFEQINNGGYNMYGERVNMRFP